MVARLFQDGTGLVEVNLRHLFEADFYLLLDHGEDVRLNANIVTGDLEALLGNAILHVIRRHVGQ